MPDAGRLSGPAPPRLEVAWGTARAAIRVLRRYGEEDLARLKGLALAFLDEKALEPAGELHLNHHMAMLIAVQACIPILRLDLDWYRGWRSVIVYPGDFLARHQHTDDAGVVHELEHELSGEAWERGPVVLSWEAVREGARGDSWGNVVIHEMAHKLDLLNGSANGMPPLHRHMDRGAWSAAFNTAYAKMNGMLDRGEETLLDEYAADDPGEFFAVASEAFFAHPADLDEWHPEVFAQLAAFYRQDPRG